MRMQLLDILSGTADSVAATVTFANEACYVSEIEGLVICTECTQVYLSFTSVNREREREERKSVCSSARTA
jgi:hypothetical protein